ncbi:MAG: helix-turn-helix domain-containing protein [Clostridiaceae bacterium]|nr:helix-turn-helix domain-containing protein [Clostridiaceae bacterium]
MYTSFQYRLQLILIKKNISLNDLHYKTGISKRTLNKIDNPKLETLIKIAKFLNVSLDELAGFKLPVKKKTEKEILLNAIAETTASIIPDRDRKKLEEEWKIIEDLGLDDIIYKPYALLKEITPCIYLCFDDNDTIIYIGRTTCIKGRIENHKLNTYWWKEVIRLFFALAKCETDMAIYEIYYINKFKPKYNQQDKFNDCCSLKLDELLFNEYEEIR